MNLHFESVNLELIADGAHYQRLVQKVMCEARFSLWIATATLKDTRIEQEFLSYRSIVENFDNMANRGCEIRILYGSEPSKGFQNSLQQHNPKVFLRYCPRVHSKIVLVDGYQLYLGSANLTGAGLGAKASHRRNFELGIFTRHLPLIREVREYFETIWDRRTCQDCCQLSLCRHIKSEIFSYDRSI